MGWGDWARECSVLIAGYGSGKCGICHTFCRAVALSRLEPSVWLPLGEACIVHNFGHSLATRPRARPINPNPNRSFPHEHARRTTARFPMDQALLAWAGDPGALHRVVFRPQFQRLPRRTFRIAQRRPAAQSGPAVHCRHANGVSLRRHVRRAGGRLHGAQRRRGQGQIPHPSPVRRGQDPLLHRHRRPVRCARRRGDLHALHARGRRPGRRGVSRPFRLVDTAGIRAAGPLSVADARLRDALDRRGLAPQSPALRHRSAQRADDHLRTAAGDVHHGGRHRQPGRGRQDAVRLRLGHPAADDGVRCPRQRPVQPVCPQAGARFGCHRRRARPHHAAAGLCHAQQRHRPARRHGTHPAGGSPRRPDGAYHPRRAGSGRRAPRNRGRCAGAMDADGRRSRRVWRPHSGARTEPGIRHSAWHGHAGIHSRAAGAPALALRSGRHRG